MDRHMYNTNMSDSLGDAIRDAQLIVTIMRHALNNNAYGSMNGSRETEIWFRLVKQGHATHTPAPAWMIDDHLFRLTDKGVDFIVNYTIATGGQ
jgi:hypothetical protein